MVKPTVQPEKTQAAKPAQQELEGLSLDQVKLKVGDSIQLQFQTDAENIRCFVTLIGYLADQGVIVTMPVVNGRILPVGEGKKVIARFFSGKNAYAFSTVTRKSSSDPFPYLHLSYPNEVRGIVVRGNSRAQANINCNASTTDGKSYKSVARDLSLGGALISVHDTIGKVGDKLILKLPVKIGQTEQMLTLRCVIRSVINGKQTTNEAPANQIGLSFENMTTQEIMVISTLLYQNIVSSNDFRE